MSRDDNGEASGENPMLPLPLSGYSKELLPDERVDGCREPVRWELDASEVPCDMLGPLGERLSTSGWNPGDAPELKNELDLPFVEVNSVLNGGKLKSKSLSSITSGDSALLFSWRLDDDNDDDGPRNP